MIDKIKLCFIKYREAIMYLIFGVLTTGVNAIVYSPLRIFFHLSKFSSSVIAWIVAVAFAYTTNKIWVFQSKNYKNNIDIKEIITFFYARILSLGLNIGILYFGVELLKIHEAIVYIFANIIVVLFNYFASKWFVFKKKN